MTRQRALDTAGRSLSVFVFVFVVVVSCVSAVAQNPQAILPRAGLPQAKTVSVAEYRTHLQSLRQLVADCARSASACDPARIGDDNLVRPDSGASYLERFGWMRDLLDDRKDPDHTQRAELLPHAAQRLAEQEASLDAVQPPQQLTAAQRAGRTSVLERREFRSARDYSLSERVRAWIADLLNRFFGGFNTLGRAIPWLGTAVQWGALALAAALLMVWVFRALDRSRVALGRLGSDAARRSAEQDAESRAWADRAHGHADRGEWRDAVHALYWASIVALEDRRTLRRSSTRTPREALRLIDPASHLREPLRSQTGAFERIWYGQQAAAADDYAAALAHYQVLQAGSRGAA